MAGFDLSVGVVAGRRRNGRWGRRLIVVSIAALLLQIGFPTAQPPVDGDFPSLAGLFSWLTQRPVFAGGNLPGLPKALSGGAAGHAHYVGAATDTGGGVGRDAVLAKGARPDDTDRSPEAESHRTDGPARDAFDEKTSKRIDADATETSEVYRNSDGSYTRKIFQDPVNYRGADGKWKPIDRGLVAGASGRLQQKANSTDITFSAVADDAELVKLGIGKGKVFAYGLAGAASVTPIIEGNTALYRDIFPDVDLKLEVLAQGVKESLILHSANAPASYAFPLAMPGMSAELGDNGALVIKDSSGEVVMTMPTPFMQDASFDMATGDFTRSDAVHYQLVEVGGQTVLRMDIDAAWAADPKRVYPITIDPTSNFNTTGDTYVYSSDTSDHSAENNLPVGTYDSGTHKARSLLHFSGFGTTYKGNTVSSAFLAVHLTWTFDCTARQFDVKPITSAWEAATTKWPGPTLGAAVASATPNPGAACTNTSGDRSKGIWVFAPFSSLSTLQGWISGATPNNGLALTASESTSNQWKRFTSRNYANYAYQPYIRVSYAGNKPPQVDMMYPPYGYQSPTLTPTLIGAGHDPDRTAGKFTYDFTVKDKDDDSVVADSGKITASNWVVPKNALEWGKTYTWTVKTNDSLNDSTTTEYMFSVPVPQPRLTSTLAQNGGLGFSAVSGNYTTSATDAEIATVGPQLSIVRSYNSADPRVAGAFGAGWSSIADASALRTYDAAGSVRTVIITAANGQQTAFGANANGTLSPPPGRYATVDAVSDAAGTVVTTNLASAIGFRMVDKDGATYVYTQSMGAGTNRFGLTKIIDVHGNVETFGYDTTPRLISITSASGRTLTLIWSTPSGATSAHVASVATDPTTAGNSSTVLTWTYGYSGDLLTSVCTPASTVKCHSYSYTASSTPYSLYPVVVKDIGPRAYLRLADAAASGTAADSIGAANGTVHGGVTFGSTSTPSLLSSAAPSAVFNGASGYIEQPSSPGMDAQQRSISMWFKTNTAGGVLLGQSNQALGANSAYPYTPNLFIASDGTLRGQFATTMAVGGLGSLLGAASGRCVDVKGNTNADGAFIQLYSCNGQSNQSWTFNPSGVISNKIGGVAKCLDVTGGGTANGTYIQQYTCSFQDNQRWVMASNGTIINVGSGRCLTAEGTADLARLTIRDCVSPAAANQVWSRSYHSPINTGSVVTDGAWHHVVITGGANPTSVSQDQRIYLDGVLKGSITGVDASTGQGFLQIGGGYQNAGWSGQTVTSTLGTPSYFNGSIGEVAIFQHTLTQDDINALQSARSGSFRLLSSVKRPSGKTTTTIGYDRTTSSVNQVDDANTGTWKISGATVQGSYLVHSSAVLAAAPADYWRLADLDADDATNEINGGIATYNSVTLGQDAGPFDNPNTSDDDGFTRAAAFDGTSSFLQLPETDIPRANPVSVSMWFKVPNGNTTGGTLFGYQGGTLGQAGISHVPALFVGTDGKLHAKFWGFPDMTSSATVNNGAWHHVALAASGTSQTLYLDGVASGTVAGTLLSDPATVAYVGAGSAVGWPSGSSNSYGYFTGDIAEFAYYNAQLSEAQVTSMFGAWDKAKGAALARKYVITDPTNGSKASQTFEVSTGRKIAQTDGLGKQTTYGYNVDGYLYTTTDPLGNVIKNWYDPRGNIIQTQSCQDVSEDSCASTYSTYYPDSTTKVHTRDANGRYSPCNDTLIAQRAQGSSSDQDPTYLTAYTCDPATGNRAVVTDALGRQTTTVFTDGTTIASYPAGSGYAPKGLMSSQVAPDGGLRSIVYYHNGDVYSVTDAVGKVTTFIYDNIGRVISKTESTDTLGSKTTAIAYDKMSRPIQLVSPASLNKVTGATHTPTTTTVYDDDGNVFTQTVSDSTGGDAARTVTMHYDANGHTDWIEDAEHNRTTYAHTVNSIGRLVSTTDPAGVTTQTQYDTEDHELTQTIKGWTGDPANPTPHDLILVSKAYDDAGRLASITNAKPGTNSNGVTTTYEYYDNSLLKKIVVHDNSSTATYVKEEDFYDPSNALTRKVTNNGATTITYVVDPAGRTTSTTLDPGASPHLNRTTAVAYDAADLPVSTTDLDGSGNVIGYSEAMYTAMGRPIAETQYNTTATGLSPTPPVTPVGRWQLNQTTGTNVMPAAGNVSGSATAVGWSSDASRGPVANFDGTSSKISYSTPAVDTTQSFTVSMWVRLDAKDATRYVIAMPGYGGSSAFKIGYDASSDVWTAETGRRKPDGATQWVEVNSSAGLVQSGAWTHLAVTVDKPTNTMTMYVNGAAAGTATSSVPLNNRASYWWNLGTEYNQYYFKGAISDVQMYQRALTAGEVQGVKSGSLPSAQASVIRTSYKIDKGGLTTATTDPNGNTTTYTLDEVGRVALTKLPITMVENTGGQATSIEPTTAFGYNTFGEKTETKNALGRTAVTGYDANGRIISVTAPSYTAPGTSTQVTPVTSTTYDGAGRVATQTDALGGVTTYQYDQLGRVISVTTPGRSGSETAVTRYGYDEVGNRISTVDALGATTAADYDYLSRATKVYTGVRQDGNTYVTLNAYGTGAYGDPGLLTKVTSPSGVKVQTAYNAAGEKISTTDPAGNTTRYTYDSSGQPVTITMPDGRSTATTYDLAGRPTSTAYRDKANTQRYTTSQTYDAAGHLLTVTDAMGRTTAYTYDVTNMLTSEQQPVTSNSCAVIPLPSDCIGTSFGYDAAGNQTRFTDGRGNQFLTTYNAWGLPESTIEPATDAYPNLADRTYTTSYDAVGRPTTQSQPGGITVTSTYDNAGNLIGQTGSGAEAATATRTFGYDLAGRVTSFTGATGTNSVTYDDRGLVKTISGGDSGSTSYGYDSDGRITQRTDAAGLTTFAYKATSGLLDKISNAGAGISETFTYDEVNAVKTITYGATNTVRTYTFDNLHMLSSDELTTGTTSVAKISYGWDFNGNELAKTTTGFNGSASNTYEYDNANRLTSWTANGNKVSYAYDKSGNRTQSGGNQFTYDQRNRLTSSVTSTYTYTARGTLSSTYDGTNTVSTAADAYGQIISQDVSGAPSATKTYAYDALGRVVHSNAAYSGLGNDLAEDSTGTTYVRDSAGGVIAEGTGTSLRYAWTDLHQDVVGQFQAGSTTLAGSTTYDPLGKLIAPNSLIGSLGYQSEWTEQDTGRVNMAARWYNTDTGQFDSRDTVSNSPKPASVNANRYAYGNQNPLINTDPSGHFPIDPDFGGRLPKGERPSLAPKRYAPKKPRLTVTLFHPCTVWAPWAPPGCQPGTNKRMDNVAACPMLPGGEPNYYANCTIYEDLGDGTVCINHVCMRKEDCGAEDCRDIAQALDDMAGYSEEGYGDQNHATAFTAEVYGQAIERAAQAEAERQRAVDEAKARVEEEKRQAECSSNAWNWVKCQGSNLKDAVFDWAKAHPQLAGAIAGGVAGVLCGLAIGWTGAGAVACGALAGAVGSLITGLAEGHTGWQLLGDVAIGATIGAITGGAFSVGSAALGGLARGGAQLMSEAGSAEIANIAAGFGSKVAANELRSVAGTTVKGWAYRAESGLFNTAGGCLTHSFDPDTPVATADGKSQKLSDLKVGEKVLATDPETGETVGKPITALHINQDHDLTDVTIRNEATGKTSVLHTTQHHPFWDATDARWVDASKLRPGHQLRALHSESLEGDQSGAGLGGGGPGVRLSVVSVASFVGAQTMLDLTVADIHTYYVLAGDQPALVHNNNGGCVVVPNKMSPTEAAHAQELGDYAGAGNFVGQGARDMPGIDGWMDGIPTSLKDITGSSPSAVFRHASKAEAQLMKAGYSDAVVSLRAPNVSDTVMRDFIEKGNLADITTQGTVGQIFIRTDTSWIYCVAGTCA